MSTIIPGGLNSVPGKHLHIYRFGGKGNDWCFVRTPEHYDPNRVKPYKFIICNHGNGTIMDGSGYRATWTPRTMFLNPDSPFFDKKYDMIATTDDDLQFSNPTIELLLSEDYIVCGCENYGDALYGNDECRNACADFYNHMVQSYNVIDTCYMIGASNGAITSINAAILLKDKIKALILQYPLTCLVKHYFASLNHRKPILKAYGINKNDPTENEMIAATWTHDILQMANADGILDFYFPPTKLYYSMEDEITPAASNSIPFRDLLIRSGKIVEEVICQGGHGDISHFDPKGFCDFFEPF